MENPRTQFKAMRECLKNGIRIYPIPYGSRFKIAVERNGKVKIGQVTYEQNPTETNPGLFEKIQELYTAISEKLSEPVTQKI